MLKLSSKYGSRLCAGGEFLACEKSSWHIMEIVLLISVLCLYFVVSRLVVFFLVLFCREK